MRISDWSSDVCSSDLLLFVAAPEKLGEKELFAIDQFLMKGGTVVLAASPFVPTFAQGFAARKVDTGLEDWLAHHGIRSEEHTSELQSLMRISYAVFCLKKKKKNTHKINNKTITLSK